MNQPTIADMLINRVKNKVNMTETCKHDIIKAIEDQKKLQENIDWAFVALSEAQELAHMGMGKEAAEKINRAKRILSGKYQVLEEGFAIEVL